MISKREGYSPSSVSPARGAWGPPGDVSTVRTSPPVSGSGRTADVRLIVTSGSVSSATDLDQSALRRWRNVTSAAQSAGAGLPLSSGSVTGVPRCAPASQLSRRACFVCALSPARGRWRETRVESRAARRNHAGRSPVGRIANPATTSARLSRGWDGLTIRPTGEAARAGELEGWGAAGRDEIGVYE